MISSWILVVVMLGHDYKFYSQEIEYDSIITCKIESKEWSNKPKVVSTHCKKLVSK